MNGWSSRVVRIASTNLKPVVSRVVPSCSLGLPSEDIASWTRWLSGVEAALASGKSRTSLVSTICRRGSGDRPVVPAGGCCCSLASMGAIELASARPRAISSRECFTLPSFTVNSFILTSRDLSPWNKTCARSHKPGENVEQLRLLPDRPDQVDTRPERR